MSNTYRDTDDRYRNDPAFRTAVDYMMYMATEHSFTPGELKQIAFKAALELELRSKAPFFHVDESPIPTEGGGR